jgi:hypothetical protein
MKELHIYTVSMCALLCMVCIARCMGPPKCPQIRLWDFPDKAQQLHGLHKQVSCCTLQLSAPASQRSSSAMQLSIKQAHTPAAATRATHAPTRPAPLHQTQVCAYALHPTARLSGGCTGCICMDGPFLTLA